MATYTEFSELPGTDSNSTEDVLLGTSPGPPMFIAPIFKRPTSTLSPGHAAILEMHANSQSNAIIYVMKACIVNLETESIVFSSNITKDLKVNDIYNDKDYKEFIDEVHQNVITDGKYH
ncbi:uncharacterized protein NPIL_21671 [Nephila pilipes]|uniref:Uncharacterized protein n=1 Tax=Nephila pilipes TaxID=299642 RepID=A0A8X6ID50_NEPPI|nr:uncharacterized protein NPIL_21671 [Nephila pilipes]